MLVAQLRRDLVDTSAAAQCDRIPNSDYDFLIASIHLFFDNISDIMV